MNGCWIVLGFAAAALALPYARHRRRRAERARIDRTRMTVEAWLPAVFSRTSASELNPKQPDGSGVDGELPRPTPPPFVPTSGGAVRPRRRVVLSANDLSTTLGPGWKFRPDDSSRTRPRNGEGTPSWLTTG